MPASRVEHVVNARLRRGFAFLGDAIGRFGARRTSPVEVRDLVDAGDLLRVVGRWCSRGLRRAVALFQDVA